jgi:hypothetical protein
MNQFVNDGIFESFIASLRRVIRPSTKSSGRAIIEVLVNN